MKLGAVSRWGSILGWLFFALNVMPFLYILIFFLYIQLAGIGIRKDPGILSIYQGELYVVSDSKFITVLADVSRVMENALILGFVIWILLLVLHFAFHRIANAGKFLIFGFVGYFLSYYVLFHMMTW